MAAYGLLTMYNLTASIGVSQGSDPPGTWTYAELAEGFDNIAEALNGCSAILFLIGQGIREKPRYGNGPGVYAHWEARCRRSGSGLHFQ